MCHCSLRHLPQSMSFSPSLLPLGIMKSSVAITICILAPLFQETRLLVVPANIAATLLLPNARAAAEALLVSRG